MKEASNPYSFMNFIWNKASSIVVTGANAPLVASSIESRLLRSRQFPGHMRSLAPSCSGNYISVCIMVSFALFLRKVAGSAQRQEREAPPPPSPQDPLREEPALQHRRGGDLRDLWAVWGDPASPCVSDGL